MKKTINYISYFMIGLIVYILITDSFLVKLGNKCMRINYTGAALCTDIQKNQLKN